MSRIVAKIVEGLKAEGIVWPGGAGNAVIKRLRPGMNARSSGAWSWLMEAKDFSAAPFVGSCDPASDIARYGFTIDDHNGVELVAKAHSSSGRFCKRKR